MSASTTGKPATRGTAPASTTSPSRTTGATSTWTIDPAHTHVGFGIKHLMIATVRGRFTQVEGTVTLNDSDPTSVNIDITIPTGSVSTADEMRDAHLRSADFFDAERYPNMTFRSTRVEMKSSDAYRVVGDLTIRNVTREVSLDVRLLGRAKDPWGKEHAALEATTKINRADYGLTWNAVLEAGGVLVGENVTISIEAQLLRQTAGRG